MSRPGKHIHLEIIIDEDGTIEDEKLYSTEDGSDTKIRLQTRDLTMAEFISFMTSLQQIGQNELKMIEGLRSSE